MNVGNEKLKGRHSTVRIVGDTVVKKFPPSLIQNFFKEVRFLSSLQHHDFVPKLYGFNVENLEVKMEYVKGMSIKEMIKEGDYEKLVEVLCDCMDICRKLDEMRIQKGEMNHPDKHIILQKGRIVFIDFERSLLVSKPKNVTQFVMYLHKIGIAHVHSDTIAKMKAYKRKFDRKSYIQLRNAVLGV